MTAYPNLLASVYLVGNKKCQEFQAMRKTRWKIFLNIIVIIVFCSFPLGTQPFLPLPKIAFVIFYVGYYFGNASRLHPLFSGICKLIYFVFTLHLSLSWCFLGYGALQLNPYLLVFPFAMVFYFLYGVNKDIFSKKFFVIKLLFPFCFFSLFEMVFYIYVNLRHDCYRVAKEKSVQADISFCDATWTNFFKAELGKAEFLKGKDKLHFELVSFAAPRDVFVTKNPQFAYFSTGTPNMGKNRKQVSFLIKFDREQNKITSILSLPASLHDLVFDERRKVFYGVSPALDKIFVIQAEPFKIRRDQPCLPSPFYCAINADNSKLFVLSHKGKGVGAYALPSLKEIKRKTVSPLFFYMAYSSRMKKVFGSSVFTRCAVYSFDEALGQTHCEKGNPFLPITFGGSSVALDEKFLRAYVSVPYERKIYFYDMTSLKRMGSISVPFGLRIMDFDEKRGLLYAGDYVHGNVLVIDGKKEKIIKKIFVGRKIRDVFFSESADRLFVASTNGFFEINPNAF